MVSQGLRKLAPISSAAARWPRIVVWKAVIAMRDDDVFSTG
jgi:hypothetical protein